MFNNEDMVQDTMSSFAVRIKNGDEKVIMYIDKGTAARIMRQIHENHGQLNQTTAMAIAHSVAAAVARLHDYERRQLMATEHKPSNTDYDIEEADDPRTIFTEEVEDDV